MRSLGTIQTARLAWVRIASSVRVGSEAVWGPRSVLSRTRTLEAMRTQGCSLLFAGLLLCLLSSSLLAQAPDKGVISGRVVTEEGAGLPGITVRLSPVGPKSRFSAGRTVSTDDEGNFRFTDLPPRAYSLQAENGRAYVRAPQSAAERAQTRYYHIGESGTLTMMRGGVITGRVTNAGNEALIALPLAAIPVRDAEGNPIGNQAVSPSVQAFTDDRGIYRFYGLTPGTYVVLANSGNPYWGSQTSLYDNEAPTYYPSSTRDTALEVQVTSGSEATGIDIRYRGERGHAVSGKVIGGKDAQVSLVQAATGAQIALGFVYRGVADETFDLYGISDGEYEIIARTGTGSDVPAASQPRRITVRGADVTGLELRMLALGSLAGRVVIETSPTPCDKPVKTAFPEFALTAHPEKGESESAIKPMAAEAPVNDKGEFVIGELQAIRYRLALNLPNETLYVKSILAGTAAKPAAAKPATVSAANDFARSGFAPKQGEKLSEVTVTVTDGAASVRGKIIPANEGAKQPSRLRVFLVPAEPASGDDILRYSETLARADSAFGFTNLAPGKYWLLARAVADDEPVDRPSPPAAWDASLRSKLRKEAEAAKAEIELKACQRATDRMLRYSPAAK
jgi:hypothetical protein